MKILLLGEMSGLHMTVKEGLQELGYDVKLAANGDKWKKIPGADMPLYLQAQGRSFLNKFQNYVIAPACDKRFSGYDVVQMVGTGIFPWFAGYLPITNIFKRNKKVFTCAAGDDYWQYASWKKGRIEYENYFYENNKRIRKAHSKYRLSSVIGDGICRRITRDVEGIIPCIPFEYEIAYSDFPNVKPAVFLPVNTDKIKYKENTVRDNKIIFFHGINRTEDKGSAYIIEAMNNIKKRYSNDVECIIDGKMPYQEYIELMKKVNVVIDQCRGLGYGMNALIAMAEGKVVFTGAEESVVFNMEGECPLVNIRASVKQIEKSMESVIERKKAISEIGYNSRIYAEENHNYIKIAQNYIDTWK